jgi:glyoxylase-like metal-dependent hydrolase (beta-lactamase superfamily II)
VLVHESEWCQSNAVVVRGESGVLLIDPGIHGDEMACIASDLSELGQTVVAGFATHPHWDHMLWHPALGEATRYGTGRAVDTARVALSNGIDPKRFGIPEDAPLDLLGLLTGLTAGATEIPWDGPRVRIIEHQAHAPGHAALLIEESGVLVAGDMLSDVFMPMLDLRNAEDPIGDYLVALGLLEATADNVGVVVPGHGSVGDGDELLARITRDRAYVEALRDGRDSDDPRIGPSAKPGWEFVADVHARQVEQLAARSE